MLFEYNKKYEPEPENIVPGNFSYDHPCLWIVYPPGSAGDLLASIINQHYLATGCRYKGINSNGRVIFKSTDNKITNLRHQAGTLEFNEQWIYDVSDALSEKNLCDSIVDQYIFANHMFQPTEIELILNTFSQAKIINITTKTARETALVKFMQLYKNSDVIDRAVLDSNLQPINNDYAHSQVLNVPFGSLLNETEFDKSYNSIVKHLNLAGQLINYNYINYWKSKQLPTVQEYINEHFA